MNQDSYIALKHSEMEFRALSEQAAVGVTEAETATGRYVFVNQRFADIVGYTRDELLTMSFHALTEPDDLVEDLDNLGRLLKGDLHEYAMEKRYRRKDGTAIWVSLTVSPLWMEGEPPRYVIGVVEDITERKRAKEEIQFLLNRVQAEKDLQTLLLNSMVDEVWFADTSGHFTLANPAACRAFALETPDGIDVQSFAGSLEVLRPDGSPRPIEEAPPLRALTGETVVDQEENVRLPRSGELRYRLVNASPVRDPRGDIVGCVSVVRDITERKRAEEALRKSEKLYHSLFENMLNGFAYCQMHFDDTGRPWDFTYLSVNSAFKALTGLKNVAGKNATDVIPGIREADPRLLEIYGRVSKTGKPERFEMFVDSLKMWFWVSVYSPEHGYFVAVFDVITKRKQAEETLRESEAKFRAMVETIPLAIYLSVGVEQTCEYVNPKMVELFGYTLADIPSAEKWWPLAYPDEEYRKQVVEEWTRRVQHAIDTQSPMEPMEVVVTCKDGSKKNILWAYITTGDKNYSCGLDLTDRKRAEEEKAKLQTQLYQSQKVAAIGQLAGGVAHDFNNLLTGILGNIALMRSSLPPTDPLLENLNAAETSAQRAADLTKGLLMFSHNAVVLSVPTNVKGGLDASLALLKQSLPATMEIVRDYEQTVWNVLLDQSQITQILLNLAVNARDAMNGKGTLTVKARNEVVGQEYVQNHLGARTGEFVHISVMDTGPGLSTEVMQHLFEPFYTTKPVGSGTGLGLSIVYGAVKQAGGWITAVSTEGAGATFDIYLPRCLEEPTQSAAPSPLSEDVCSGTVLVVEDEPVVCAVAQTLLSRKGYTVLTAPDGASAVNVLRNHPVGIGLILLDMTMPGMTTAEIIRAIRALDTTVPILLNSGYTSNGSVQHMLDDGSVQGFLGKPYDLHQLLGRVQELLRRT